MLLQERGWSQKTIESMAPKAVVVKHHKGVMFWYPLKLIEEIEKTEKFKITNKINKSNLFRYQYDRRIKDE